MVLILGTGNSRRSQMAEGILRAAAGDLSNVQGTGSQPAGYVHPLAMKALAEIGLVSKPHDLGPQGRQITRLADLEP